MPHHEITIRFFQLLVVYRFTPPLWSFHRMFSITAHSKRGCKTQTREINTWRIPFSHYCSSHRFEKNIRYIKERYKNTKKMPCYKYLSLIKVYSPRAPLPLLTIPHSSNNTQKVTELDMPLREQEEIILSWKQQVKSFILQSIKFRTRMKMHVPLPPCYFSQSSEQSPAA